jgi:hypothetical protein
MTFCIQVMSCSRQQQQQQQRQQHTQLQHWGGGGVVTRRHVRSHAAAYRLWIKPLTMWLKMGTNVLFSNVEHVHT